MNPSQPPLDGLVRQRLLILFLLAHGKHRAPHPWYAQEEEPFLRVGEVGDVAQPGHGGGEVERRARDEEALGPGKAAEPNAERFGPPAAAAVGADQPLRAYFSSSIDRDRNSVVVVLDLRDRTAEFDARLRREPLG